MPQDNSAPLKSNPFEQLRGASKMTEMSAPDMG
jgi:hypothetical protein